MTEMARSYYQLDSYQCPLCGQGLKKTHINIALDLFIFFFILRGNEGQLLMEYGPFIGANNLVFEALCMIYYVLLSARTLLEV